MKKTIYSLTLFLLTLSWATSVKAGVLENQALELFKQAPLFSENINGTEQLTFKVDTTDIITQPGVKTQRNASQMRGDVKVSVDHIQNLVELKGTVYLTDPTMYLKNHAVPLHMIMAMENDTDVKAMYLYMYPEYSKLAREKMYTSAFDGFDNSWLRVDGSEFKKANQNSSIDEFGVMDVMVNTSNWFTTTVKNVGGKKVYSVKIKPTVLIANMTKWVKSQNVKLTSKELAENKNFINALSKGKVEITADDAGKLFGYLAQYTITETETRQTYTTTSKGRKVTQTIRSTDKIGLQSTILPTEPIALPTSNVKDFSVEAFVANMIGQTARQSAKTNEQITAEKVEKLVTLSVKETPEIYTITSIAQLKQTELGKNSLFMYAQDGDIILMYEKNNKVLLYRPSYNTIVGETKYDDSGNGVR